VCAFYKFKRQTVERIWAFLWDGLVWLTGFIYSAHALELGILIACIKWSPYSFFVFCCAGLGYIVAFTKGLTMCQIYHSWMHFLHHSSLSSPHSRNCFNRYLFSIYKYSYFKQRAFTWEINGDRALLPQSVLSYNCKGFAIENVSTTVKILQLPLGKVTWTWESQ
jgi:hypothetical protein